MRPAYLGRQQLIVNKAGSVLGLLLNFVLKGQVVMRRLSVISWEGWKQTVQETSIWDGGCVADVLSRRVLVSSDLKKNFVAFSWH